MNKETTVLIEGLRFPNGVAVSKDGTFVVIAETNMARLAFAVKVSYMISLKRFILLSNLSKFM